MPLETKRHQTFGTPRFPQEIWDKILELVSPETKGLANSEIRNRLSVESFAPGLPLQSEEDHPGLKDLLNFRKCSRKFDDVSRKHIFNRLEIRFTSLRAIQRLNSFADADAIAPHVKELSYMMPRLFAYPQGLEGSHFTSIREAVKRESSELQRQIDDLLANASSSSISYAAGRQRAPLPPLQRKLQASKVMEKHVDTITQKAVDQRNIIKKKLDVQCLLYSLGRFTNLQQIRLMPLVDQADFAFEQYLDNHPELEGNLRPSLSDGFHHGASTLASAVLESGNKAHKFSSRSIDLGKSLTITNRLRTTLADMAEGMTSMDLQFVYKDSNIHEQLKIYLSIPTDRRLWVLRQVSLIEETPKEDGLWKTVLQFIRLNLRLEWFSLRGIRYNDDLLATGPMPFGNTIYGSPPAGYSDSSEDDDNILDIYSRSSSDSSETEDENARQRTRTEDSDEETQLPVTNEDRVVQGDDSDTSSSDGTSIAPPTDNDQDEFNDDSHEEHEDGMSDLDDPHTATVAEESNTTAVVRLKPAGAACYCDLGFAFEDFGGDNGHYVLKQQWKRWELWAGKRRCQIGHDPSPNTS